MEAEVQNLLAATFCSPVCGQQKRVGGGGVVWWERANVQRCMYCAKKKFHKRWEETLQVCGDVSWLCLKKSPNPSTIYVTVKTNFRGEHRGSHRPVNFYLSSITTSRSDVLNSTRLASQHQNPASQYKGKLSGIKKKLILKTEPEY